MIWRAGLWSINWISCGSSNSGSSAWCLFLPTFIGTLPSSLCFQLVRCPSFRTTSRQLLTHLACCGPVSFNLLVHFPIHFNNLSSFICSFHSARVHSYRVLIPSSCHQHVSLPLPFLSPFFSISSPATTLSISVLPFQPFVVGLVILSSFRLLF